MNSEIFGKLTLEAFKHEPSQNVALVGGTIAGIALFSYITYQKRWRYLWDEWFTTSDPKRIGIMYLIVALLMFFKAFADALMMRLQQVLSVGDSHGFISAGHYQEVFTAHGTTMIFLVGMGIVACLLNYILPLQIGARDVAFPFINSLSFWLYAAASLLTLVSLAIGRFSGAGWTGYPPLSGMEYSPDSGVDYWIWLIQIAGVGTTLSGINFIVTILKMRCKGMTFMKMPIFVWSALCSMTLVIFAFPILTATLILLTLDRYAGTHFFTVSGGGNPMMYVNLIWAWGHPEVYILILPAFGVFSEVVPTFSEKRLFGYTSMVWALVAITFLSFVVWLHHFFTMGASPKVNVFFAIMTMLIAIPTGVKIFNWLFTKFRGRVHFDSPMLWFFAFVLNFSIGGMTGILLSAPPVDFQIHNSLFLVAHFHGMVIGGFLFGFFCAFTYWFPKVTGFHLSERLNKYAFWFWFSGFLIAFMPLYMLGFMGATRRLDHYEASTGWHPLFVTAAFGAFIILIGVLVQLYGLYKAIRDRKLYPEVTGNPWNGGNLEWATSSPPPVYNFAIEPTVDQLDPLWEKEHFDSIQSKTGYVDILMPKNSAIPFFIGLLSLIFGFAIVWHIFWLALSALLAIIALLIFKLSLKDEHMVITKEQIKEIESKRLGARS